jgi:hypothetical protein
MFKKVELEHRLQLPIWFYPPSEKYYVQNELMEYVPYTKTTLKLILKSWGLRGRVHDDELQSPIDALIADVSYGKSVSYAGRLAGIKVGCYQMNGKRVLVTSDPVILEAKEGQFPMIESIVSQLFNGGEIDQRPYVYGWLKMGRKAVLEAFPMPGQALVLAGPRNAGKNLFQDIITEALGGRAEKPYRYMVGKSEFNGDLFGAEHLCIADEVPFYDMPSRRVFGSKIKDMCVNSLQSCHGKHKEALTLYPIWRLSISVNDEAENLVMLPPLEESIEDKIMLLKVDQAIMPMKSDSPRSRVEFWDAVRAEIPSFLHFIENYVVPDELQESRFGIKAFQHPDLVEILKEMTHEIRLMALMEIIVIPDNGSWKGSLEELETALLEDSTYKRQIEKLLYYPTALMTYMRRLHKSMPERVRSFRSDGKAKWELQNSTANTAK